MGASGAGFAGAGVREIDRLRLACPRLPTLAAASTASGGPTCCIADAGESRGAAGGEEVGRASDPGATACGACAEAKGAAGVAGRAAGRLGAKGERARSATADCGEVVARPGSPGRRAGGDISNERAAGWAATAPAGAPANAACARVTRGREVRMDRVATGNRRW